MRKAYEIVQRLMWDFQFREAFLQNRVKTLAKYYPDYLDEGLFSQPLSLSGLQEESYRRIAALNRTSKEIFPLSHNLLVSFFGGKFFDHVLANYFGFNSLQANRRGLYEILEPFDGYMVGPLVIHTAQREYSMETRWIECGLQFEWAVWHATRVSSGWPPLRSSHPLIDGGSLVAADFDLKSMFSEVKRLAESSVGPEVYRWRIRPGPGTYRGAIFPRNGTVVEAHLDSEIYDVLMTAITECNSDFEPDFRSVIEEIGLISNASFLCCPREKLPQNLR